MVANAILFTIAVMLGIAFTFPSHELPFPNLCKVRVADKLEVTEITRLHPWIQRAPLRSLGLFWRQNVVSREGSGVLCARG
jgi:hypothetical protein